MKYRVGDKVRVKTWKELKKQYGLDSDGDIRTPICFTTMMEEIAEKSGRLVTIKSGDDISYLIEECPIVMWWTDDMFNGLARETEPRVPFTQRIKNLCTRVYNSIQCSIANLFTQDGDKKLVDTVDVETLLAEKNELQYAEEALRLGVENMAKLWQSSPFLSKKDRNKWYEDKEDLLLFLDPYIEDNTALADFINMVCYSSHSTEAVRRQLYRMLNSPAQSS